LSGFPLTDAQTALWLHHVFLPDKPICNTGQIVSLTAPIDPELFKKVLSGVLEEADALRVRVAMTAGRPYQEVCELDVTPVDVVDVSLESDPLAAAWAWIEREFWTNIPWQTFPLFRFGLVKTAHDRYLWLQKHHHVIVDATGAELLTRRVAQSYDAQAAGQLPPPSSAAPFSTLVDSERDYRNSARFHEDEEYWLERFADLPTPLISGDRINSERSKSGRPAGLSFRIEKDVWRALEAVAKDHKSTTFKAVVVFVYIALARLYAAEDIGFGIPLSARMGKFKQTIGLFSHVMPFRLRLASGSSFSSALAQVDDLLRRDYAHRRFPVTVVAKTLQARHGRIPLYDVTVNYVPTEYDFNFGGAPVAAKNLSRGFFAPWAIAITDYGDRGLDVAVTYDQGLISDAAASQFAKHLEVLLRSATAGADPPIAAL
jgi:enterobactin synthetase component F